MILRLRSDGVVEVLTHLGDLEGHTGTVHPGLTAALRAGALAGLIAGEPAPLQRPAPLPQPRLVPRRVEPPLRHPVAPVEPELQVDDGYDPDPFDEDLGQPEQEPDEFTRAAPLPSPNGRGKKEAPRSAPPIHALARAIRAKAGNARPTGARAIDGGVEIG